MTRSFSSAPIDVDLVTHLCTEALRAPTAGNCAGVAMAVLESDFVRKFFDVATDDSWRDSAARAPELMRASCVVVISSDPAIYVTRYAESDKSRSGLSQLDEWPVPYWHVDAGMATMALLLLLEDAGLGAALWGNFRHGRDVSDLCQQSATSEVTAMVLVGTKAATDRRSTSLERQTRLRAERVLRLGAQ